MKKSKKIIAMLMVTIILMAQFTWVNFGSKTYAAETTIATKYFYNQLSDDAKVFYEAMETMMKAGYFKIGNASMEVSGLDEDKIGEFKNGSQELLNDMGAGRDAFMLDYPELFYVDFDYLSMRVTEDEKGTHVYLGTGRGDNYINKEFLKEEFLKEDGTLNPDKINNSIAAVNQRIKDIVNEAQTKKSVREQVKIAHDEVIKAAKYTLEYNTNYPYTVRTIYGVFGLGDAANAGNAVCEGYARALKAVLDRLGIPAILVRGVYDNIKDNKLEEHMWVYVQIDEVWYGVDPTFDNTDDGKETNNNVSDKYLLVSADGMNYHYPLGIISTSNFEFQYPDLDGGASQNKYNRKEGDNVVYSDASGLVVIDAGSEELGDARPKPERVFHISYNGKGYAKAAAEDGVYMITNSWQVKHNNKTGKDDVLPSEWQYPSEVMDYKVVYEDHDDYLAMRVDNITAIQVGLTDVEPEEPTLENLYDVFYKGGDNGIVAMSTDIDTGVGEIDYAQPFPVKSTPSQQLAYKVGKNKSYDIEITYDQDLIFEDEGNQRIGYDLKLYDNVYGYRDDVNQEYLKYEISEPVLKDSRTIAFTIKPSELWTMDKVQYMIQFTGVVGDVSLKEPFPAIYGFSNDTTGCIYALRAMGVDMESYSKPTLLDDFELKDILPEDYFGEDSDVSDVLQKYGDLLKNRLSLMVTNTTGEQEKKMEDALSAKLKADGRTLDGTDETDETDEPTSKTNVEMYNITLSLCTEQLKKLKDGTKLKVMIGFPLGYSYEDFAGGNGDVTFKAYHYTTKKDEDGNEILDENGKVIYDIEEIDLIVTELGFIMYVDSFSPFAIAAVKATADDELANNDKTIRLNVTEGGKVTTNNVATGAPQTDKVVYNYYYDTDSGEKKYDKAKARTFTVKPDDGYIIESVEIVKNVQKNANGKTIYETDKIELSDKNTFEVYYEKPENPENPEVIFMENPEVTFNVIFAAKDIEAQPVKVAPKTFTASAVADKDGNTISALKAGDTFEVTFSLEKSESNIYSIGGMLEYNSNLRLEKVVSANELWAVEYNDGTNQFIATLDLPNKDSELPEFSKLPVFIATFKVIGTTGTANINISDLKAGTGEVATLDTNPIAIAEDISLSIDFDGNLVLTDTAASANITVKDEYVIMPAGMTEEDFRKYVEIPSNPTITINPKQNPNPDKESTLPADTIKTGDSITVEDKTWTFSVRGDIDGDGIISVNDLAQAKLHFIGKATLTGAYLEASETDNDGRPDSVNDISRLKLVLIEKLDNLFSSSISE